MSKISCKLVKIVVKLKRHSFKPKNNLRWIKTPQHFEILSIDFKTLFQTLTNDNYLLVIIDDIYCFPFLYACKDIKAVQLSKNLRIFLICLGLPVICILTKGPVSGHMKLNP